MTTNPPSGWYPDPADPALQRYWNGFEWTEHTAAALGSGVADAEPQEQGGTPGDAWPSGGGATAAQRATGGSINTWTWQSFVVTLLCGGTVISMIGIFNAGKAEGALAAGDVDAAREYATRARNWTLGGLVFGALIIVVGVVALVAFASTTAVSLTDDCGSVDPSDDFRFALCQGYCDSEPLDPECIEFQG